MARDYGNFQRQDSAEERASMGRTTTGRKGKIEEPEMSIYLLGLILIVETIGLVAFYMVIREVSKV